MEAFFISSFVTQRMRLILFVICVGTFLSVSGQKTEFSNNAASRSYSYHDSTFILDLTQKLTLKVLLVSRLNEYSITDTSGNISTNFVPNEALSVGLGFNYKFIGFSAAFIPIASKSSDDYGKTQRLDLQTHILTRKIGADLRFSYYKGFYVNNAYALNPNLVEGQTFKRPDITTTDVSANLFYVFNSKEFSFRSLFTQNEWQKKTAGSFYAGSRFSYFSISGDTILAPLDIYDSISSYQFPTHINAFSLGVSGGYAYTLVFAKHFFVSGAIAPIFNLVNNSSNSLGNNSPDQIGRIGFTFRAGTGFNSTRYFGGLTYFLDETNLDFAYLNHNRQMFRFYFGMRVF
ncbi:MAG: hypothetical protein CL840_22430 [Crocinitomicaceae bacterium]|nr:hypothetical protein [Crocinitomicaceae bacterium]|tara:strand:- start:1177 stop:2214 length:1038 start_codon:yes stop_codon:yes gene_type:complete